MCSFKIKGSVAVTVLLFFLSSAVAETSNQSIADILNELKKLKDEVHSLETVVVEQRVELRNLETRMRESEVQAEEGRSKVLLLTAELGLMSKKVEEQRADLWVTKKKMTELEKENAGIGHRVAASEKDLDKQSKEVATLKGALSTTETEVQLQKISVQSLEKAKTIRVAFSVGLTGPVGPFDTEVDLNYDKIFTNIGKAYRPSIGKFVTSVRGIYYFRFTAFDHRDGTLFGLNFYRNEEKLMSNWEHNNGEGHLYLSNALIIQLNPGDIVYLQLSAGHSLYDDENNHNTFSGFLLFPL